VVETPYVNTPDDVHPPARWPGDTIRLEKARRARQSVFGQRGASVPPERLPHADMPLYAREKPAPPWDGDASSCCCWRWNVPLNAMEERRN